MKRVFFVFLSCAGVFLSTHLSTAEPIPNSVVITEVGAYETIQHEWFEIYNFGEAPVDMMNWTFWEGGVSHQLTLAQGVDMLLEPDEFAIVAQSAENFFVDYPHVTSTVFDSSWGTLNESGEEIGLKNVVGDFVEKFTYIPARDFSLERVGSSVFDYSEQNWMEHASGNTAGVRNSIWVPEEVESDEAEEDAEHGVEQNIEKSVESQEEPPPDNVDKEGGDLLIEEGEVEVDGENLNVSAPEEVNTPPRIVINELFPFPNEGKEWVELFNNASTTAHITGWILFDGVGQIAAVSSTVEAHSFLLIELASAKLNNSGDAVILKDAAGVVIDQVIYGDWGNEAPGNVTAPKRGVSLARQDNELVRTTTPTPNAVNVITEPVVSESQQNRTNPASRPHAEPKSSVVHYPVSTVVVNEFVSVPSEGQEEWIELYNTTRDWIDLGGWSLEDGAGTRTNISGALPPHGFFVIDAPRGRLNNAGDKIILRDPAEVAIDEVVYGNSSGDVKNNPLAPREKQSLVRTVDGQDTQNGRDFALTESITKGGPNKVKAPETSVKKSDNVPAKIPALNTTPTTSAASSEDFALEAPPRSAWPRSMAGLSISEIFPNPVGSDSGEFVEVLNSGTTTVDLSGLLLDDGEGGSRPFRIPDDTTIESGEFLVFEKNRTRLTLNNTSDSVRVLSPGGDVLLEVIYEDAQEGAAYVQTSTGEWVWTEEITSGGENVVEIFEEDGEAETVGEPKGEKDTSVVRVSLSQLRELEKGTRVIVHGVVAVEPDVLASQYFYLIESATSSEAGVQIYMYSKDFPALEVGDIVQVTGEISETSGQKRVKVKSRGDISVVRHGSEIGAQLVEVGAIGDESVGNLVSVQGEVTEKKSRYFYIDDGTDEVQIYIKAGVSVDASAWSVGEQIHVTGIVIKTKDGYQMLPRGPEDLQRVEGSFDEFGTTNISSTSTEQDNNTEPYLLATLGGGASVLLGILGKLRGAVAWQWTRKVVGVAVGSMRKKV